MNATIHYGGRDVTFYDVDEATHIGNCLFNVCWYELPNLEIIRKLHLGGNYVDAGAHIGTHTLFFSLFCPSKNVYAFEPHPPYFKNLIKNAEANNAKNVTSFNCALVEKDNDFVPLPENEGWKYEAMSLDFFQLKDVKVLKIDVESSELRVLQGAKETLKQVEHLFLEVWTDDVYARRGEKSPMADICAFLEPYGIHPVGPMPWEDLWHFSKK